jgi:8-oxo-dGTP pyrophosphatase MutT (NUDIX family)
MQKILPKARKQVAALPVRKDGAGLLRIMLMTSRETKRLIVPKGWPMKDRKDYRAAATEALEEAGLVGRVHRKPVGTYVYWKRQPERFLLCRVKVYVLEVERQLKMWREKGQRQFGWFSVDDAANLVDDAGLVPIIRNLPLALGQPKARRKRAPKKTG